MLNLLGFLISTLTIFVVQTRQIGSEVGLFEFRSKQNNKKKVVEVLYFLTKNVTVVSPNFESNKSSRSILCPLGQFNLRVYFLFNKKFINIWYVINPM